MSWENNEELQGANVEYGTSCARLGEVNNFEEPQNGRFKIT